MNNSSMSSSSSSAEAPAPYVNSPSPATRLSSPPPSPAPYVSPQIAPTSPLRPASLPPPPPPQVVASPPMNSEPPLTSPPLPLPATPTPPVISPPPPPSPSPSPPPSVTATPPISPPQLPPQPPTPPPPLILTSPPISPPPPATPLGPTLSLPPTSAPPLLPTPPPPPPRKPTLAPPFTKRPSGSPPPSALASPPPPPPSLQAPKFLTSPPEPPPLVNRSLPVKPPINGHFHISAGLAVGFLTGVIFLVIIALALLFVCCQYRRKKNHGPVEDHYKLHGLAPKGALMLKVLPNPGMSSSEGSGSGNPIPPALSLSSGTMTYDQLVVATNGFSETNLLGQGGFGYVNKGILPSGQQIAVKQLKKDSGQGEREFQAEIETISRVHHKHLVSLLGYCVTGAERLLVYEFVPNNTLEFHLHGEGRPVFEWAARMRIAVGSAKGIAYLHEDCNPAIVHRDIKASNILLDFRFEAKVSDFGLAKIFSDTNASVTHISTRVVGTFGYLAPEYASSGKVTDKSDVYSYGVMLLELITGRPPISKIDSSRNEGLVGWIVHALEGHVSLMDFDEGMPPGLGSLYGYSGSSNFDAQKCMEEMKKFSMALESQEYGFSKYSESTSEYGLDPSGSSSEFQDNLKSR
ncbi:proline-rich receptor-like protein kinase PERK2 isoform X2 [Corylus avellana]|uniref:proline-rich receptor-like protein kinase PERK2 isoform X2 n=1 Tax=Corylus avellana TaxID=13451 RepID=UPI00286A91DE|nr:proline-rich receptor-like protein kinase PERK2 isoform X2 [Corylus avellana]